MSAYQFNIVLFGQGFDVSKWSYNCKEQASTDSNPEAFEIPLLRARHQMTLHDMLPASTMLFEFSSLDLQRGVPDHSTDVRQTPSHSFPSPKLRTNKNTHLPLTDLFGCNSNRRACHASPADAVINPIFPALASSPF